MPADDWTHQRADLLFYRTKCRQDATNSTRIILHSVIQNQTQSEIIIIVENRRSIFFQPNMRGNYDS
jgi:hypothetical protein